MIQVYTGSGKGKTTAAFGLAMRAVGRGRRVLVIQFMKNRPCGEHVAARRLAPELTVERMGPSVTDELYTESTVAEWVEPESATPEDVAAAKKALSRADGAIRSGEYGMIVLDEVLSATGCGLVDVDGLVRVMRDVPEHVEVVLTGEPAPAEVLDAADLVTEMRAEKHYFDRGVRAREGIEF
jgi:cob(I)alamin adenosyltransferase